MIKLPLDAEQLAAFFEDPEAVVDVDYDASREALGSSLAVLTYVGNIGMTCVLHGEIDDQLLVEYMTSRSMTDIYNLQAIHGNILNYAKYGKSIYPVEQFDNERIEAFIVANADMVRLQVAFMNSIKMYMYCQLDPTVKLSARVTDQTFPELGFNLLKLFGVPDFMVIFMAECPPLEDLIYFERYFEENMFSGVPMYSHFHHPNNMYAGLTLTVATMDQERLKKMDSEWEVVSDHLRQATSAAESPQILVPESSTR